MKAVRNLLLLFLLSSAQLRPSVAQEKSDPVTPATLKSLAALLESTKAKQAEIIEAQKAIQTATDAPTRKQYEEALQTLQNEHGVHLCPSLSEGWGHYIVEAMSCGALTITTDGPPMNELVTPDRGLLIPSDRSEPRHLGTNWIVSVADLEAVIQRSLALTDHEKQHLGNAAREWFVSNDREFRQRFADVVRTLTDH